MELSLQKLNHYHNRLVDIILLAIEETAIMNIDNLEKVTKSFEKIVEQNNDYYFLNGRIISMTDKYYESGRFSREIKEALIIFEDIKQ